MQESTGLIGKVNNKSNEFNIIGAGISGLLLAYYLKKSGFQVKVFEKDNRIGGKIQTQQTDFGPIEKAANAIYTNQDVYELLEELNLEYQTATSKLKKYIWKNNKAKSPPFNFSDIFRIICNLFKKINKQDLEKQSIYDFFAPLVGQKFAEEVLSAALGGIYADSSKNLHFKSIFKKPFTGNTYFKFFLEIKKLRSGTANRRKPTSISFKNGMSEFIQALKNNLEECIFTGVTGEIDFSKNTIICTDAYNASEILKEYPKVSSKLKEIKYNSLSTVTVITDKEISYLKDAFGIVIPPTPEISTLGVLSNSEIFQNRTKNKNQFSYTLISKIDEYSNIQAQVYRDLSKLTDLNVYKDIKYYEEKKWEKAIPVYNYNRYKCIFEIRSMFCELPNGILLFGNYIDGISIRELIVHAKNFSLELK